MKSFGVLLPLCAVVLLDGSNTTRAATEVTQPAVWVAHELTIKLQNLPKRYSCEELHRKFRDILVRIGARQSMRIRASRCERALGARARSPRIDLRFELPQALNHGESGVAELAVVSRTVRIAPGEPESLEVGDCQLLRQINWFLLAMLPTRIVEFNLACRTPTAHPEFRVSVETLVLVEPARRMAR